METTLHRQLKEHYADGDARLEVPLERFRIDVVRGDRLIEIQHGPLAAIRDKTAALLDAGHRILIVKPIITRKQLVKQVRRGGDIVSKRLSPKRGRLLDLFDDLVHFTRVFPHERLALDVPLVEIEEIRYPGHGRRRWRRSTDHVVEDQRLVALTATERFSTATDLLRLLPARLPQPFNTADLAGQLGVERWHAQRITYCLRTTGAAKAVGRRNRAWLYKLAAARPTP